MAKRRSLRNSRLLGLSCARGGPRPLDGHQDDQQAEKDHEVIAGEGQQDGRPLLLREIVEPLDPGLGVETDEEAEHPRDPDREVRPLVLLVGIKKWSTYSVPIFKF